MSISLGRLGRDAVDLNTPLIRDSARITFLS